MGLEVEARRAVEVVAEEVEVLGVGMFGVVKAIAGLAGTGPFAIEAG